MYAEFEQIMEGKVNANWDKIELVGYEKASLEDQYNILITYELMVEKD